MNDDYTFEPTYTNNQNPNLSFEQLQAAETQNHDIFSGTNQNNQNTNFNDFEDDPNYIDPNLKQVPNTGISGQIATSLFSKFQKCTEIKNDPIAAANDFLSKILSTNKRKNPK